MDTEVRVTMASSQGMPKETGKGKEQILPSSPLRERG